MNKIVRIITLYQPYATLLAYGIKMNETRPVPTSHTFEKGIYLIHAAKKWTKESISKCYEEPFYSELIKLGFIQRVSDINSVLLPLGKIIGSFQVKECMRVITNLPNQAILEHINSDMFFEPSARIKYPELSFGDYSMNRSVWIGQNHKVLKDPIPYKGQQGYYAKFKGDINQLKFL